MTTHDPKSRFASIERLYGRKQASLLRELHICIVGMGGVGSWAAEALARTGIGQLTFIDYDTICQSNINRQVHALDSTVDQKKNSAMAERIKLINPECQCHIIDDYLTLENVRDYLSPDRGYDYVIDAIDSIKFKSAIIYQCKRNKIPIISTGGAGGLTDPTLIDIKDLTRVRNDPLAAKVRAQLRAEYGFSRNTKRYFGIECVYSHQQPLYPTEAGEVSHAKPGIHGVSLDCSMGYGSVTHVTATFGFVAAGRAIDKILKKRLRQP